MRLPPSAATSGAVRVPCPTVELGLGPDVDAGVVEASRRAAVRAGVVLEAALASRGPWWFAGVAETVEGRSVGPTCAPGYEIAPSPRSTRGATRA
jgi:hypothetical protein